MISLPTQTFFVDESGNSGWDDVGRVLVLAGVTGPSPDLVKAISMQVRDGYASTKEFKWRHVEKKKLRPRIVARLSRTKLRYFAIAVDLSLFKKNFPERVSTSNALYQYAIDTLYGMIEHAYPNAITHLIIDGEERPGIPTLMGRAAFDLANLPPGSRDEYRGHTRTLTVPMAGSRKSFRTIAYDPFSEKNPGLQMADFIAGAIRHSLIKKDDSIRSAWKEIEMGFAIEPHDHPEGTAIDASYVAEAPMKPGKKRFHFPQTSFRPNHVEAPGRRTS